MEEIMMETIILVSLAAAFTVLLVKKWGWAERMQLHGDRFLSRLFSSDLCMSFWACVIISIVVCVVTGEDQWIVVPLFSTPLTRMLV